MAMPRYLSALAFFFVVTAALAGDDDPVRLPYVEVGDCWTYRAKDSLDQPNWSSSKSCVTYVDKSKNLIFTVLKTQKGRERDRTFTSEWNPISTARSVFLKAPRYLQFPLHVGDAYSCDDEYRQKRNEQGWARVQYDIKVVGWDDVTVPAGSFRALRIEATGTGRRLDRTNAKPFRHQLTIWYVPAVNREVKRIFSSTSGRESIHELTEYSLNK